MDMQMGETHELDGFKTDIKPPIAIPSDATRIHGITNKMVRDSPTFEEAAEELRDFIGDLPVVGHNVLFDLNFLNTEFRRADEDTLFENEAYCTMRAYQKLYGGRSSLDAVVDALGLGGRTGRHHDALEDVKLTVGVALMLARGQKPITTWSEETTTTPVERPKRSSFWKYFFGFLVLLGLWMSFRGCDASSQSIASENSSIQNAYSQDGTTRQIQLSLSDLGYEVTVDGVYGPQTKAAIEKYQSANDLAVTGEIDMELRNLLLQEQH